MSRISITKPSILLYWEGKLCEVVGIGEGKTIHLTVLRDRDKEQCANCGHPQPTEYSWLESSPVFQDGVKPVETLPSQDGSKLASGNDVKSND